MAVAFALMDREKQKRVFYFLSSKLVLHLETKSRLKGTPEIQVGPHTGVIRSLERTTPACHPLQEQKRRQSIVPGSWIEEHV